MTVTGTLRFFRFEKGGEFLSNKSKKYDEFIYVPAAVRADGIPGLARAPPFATGESSLGFTVSPTGLD